jgi:transposase
MAMGRQTGQQGEMILAWDELPRSPGHVFYDRLQEVLREAGFDAFAEDLCRPYYAAVLGAPSLPPGRYCRMHLVGYFEGIASERGLEWRCADSLALRRQPGAAPTAWRCADSLALRRQPGAARVPRARAAPAGA